MRIKLISGGQTGVDRAALEVALGVGLDCGGWCPEGRLAEDGPIPERYPVQVLPGGDYCARTLANVVSSDGTLMVYFESLAGRTELTLRFCLEFGKPYLVDASEVPPPQGAQALARFVAKHRIQVLNVAGPRASAWPEYAYTCALLSAWLQRIP